MSPEPSPVVRTLVRRNLYADSVTLMQVTAAVAALPGVRDAAVVMGTELNREVLGSSDLLVDEAAGAGPNDLVIAVRAESADIASSAVARAEAILAESKRDRGGASQQEPARSIRSATRRLGPEANLAFVSVPGPYAAAEARQALLEGLNVLLFSDNVALEDEVTLKELANQLDLLVMGPDCGTAIVNGVGLGFANVVRRGHIGLVGASGTGMQEVSVLVHRAGKGISQAIGTGGRDLHERVGGMTTLRALELLADDADTTSIVLVSKPPSPAVAERVLQAAASTGKPLVACLLGWQGRAPSGVQLVPSLEAAATAACGNTTAASSATPDLGPLPPGRVLGLYCGGTLAEEAELAVGDGAFVDFGDDRYTRGRAHPMIDPTLRNQAILDAGDDESVSVVLLDVILGYGAHADPAGVVAPAIEQAQARARQRGRALAFFAHVVGTSNDPQDLARQEAALRSVGVHLFDSNFRAAAAARELQRGAR